MPEKNPYGDVANMGDVQLERTVLPAGTKVTTQITDIELEDANVPNKAYFVFSFTHLAPDEVEGESFQQRMYLGLRPSSAASKGTSFQMAKKTIKSILCGIFESEQEVLDLFVGVPHWNGDNDADVYAAMLERLQSVVSATFDTELKVEFDGTIVKDPDTGEVIAYEKAYNPDGSPKMVKRGNKEVQAGQYGPKQDIGKVAWKFKPAPRARAAA